MTFSFGILQTAGTVILIIFLAGILLFIRKKYLFFTGHKQRALKIWNELKNSLNKRHYEINRLINLGDAYITGAGESLKHLKSFARRYPLAPKQKDVIELNKQLPQILTAFFADAEQVPEIKKHPYFSEIRNIIAHIHADLNKQRPMYNTAAEEFNKIIQSFPYNFFAFFSGTAMLIYFVEPEDAIKITGIEFDLPFPPIS